MQTKDDLEKWYKYEDPWGYKTNRDDFFRKERILKLLKNKTFNKALDIGCGEGFITKDLPAKEIYGYDISEIAMNRLPNNVIPINNITGKFDLIIATGVVYSQYDFKWIVNIINSCACGTVLTCHLSHIENKYINKLKNQVYIEEFPYRNMIERLRIYDYST